MRPVNLFICTIAASVRLRPSQSRPLGVAGSGASGASGDPAAPMVGPAAAGRCAYSQAPTLASASGQAVPNTPSKIATNSRTVRCASGDAVLPARSACTDGAVSMGSIARTTREVRMGRSGCWGRTQSADRNAIGLASTCQHTRESPARGRQGTYAIASISTRNAACGSAAAWIVVRAGRWSPNTRA